MPTEIIHTAVAGISEMLVYVAIGLVMLVGLLKCIYPVYRNGTLLNRAVRKLERSTAEGENAAWRDQRFLGRAFQGEWQRFLLNAAQLDIRGMPCDTVDYINEDTAVYKPGHGQLAELIPSLLTSLGILGTFLGLMEGLTNVNFTDASSTMESIPALLGGMRFAFATSVVGILFSLIFNMLNRIVVGRAFKALDHFEEAFYELAMPRPLDADVQLLCLRQDDEANMEKMIQGIGGQLAVTMESVLSHALHPLAMSMDNFMKGASKEQVDGIQVMVNQFVQQMNASLEGQVNMLAESMYGLTQTQMQAQQTMLHTLETSERLAVDAQRMQAASNEMAVSLQSLAQQWQRAPGTLPQEDWEVPANTYGDGSALRQADKTGWKSRKRNTPPTGDGTMEE